MAIEAAAGAVIDLKDSLNDWDSKVGDGDCGSTVSHPVKNILRLIYCKLHMLDFPHVLHQFLGACTDV